MQTLKGKRLSKHCIYHKSRLFFCVQSKAKYYFCPLSLHNSLRRVKITLQKPLSSRQSLCYNLFIKQAKTDNSAARFMII